MHNAILIFAMLLAAAGCASVSATSPSPVTPVVSAAEAQQRLVAKGRSQFLHCNLCHVVDAAAPPPFGDMQFQKNV